MSDSAGRPVPPVLRIVKGDPTPLELAALVTVLAARQHPASTPEPARSAWADARRAVRRLLYPAPGGWRASGLPGHDAENR